MNNLPSRFLRITASKNQLLRRLEQLRVSRSERQSQGHVLVQGIKTIQELASKGHPIRTLGITFDESNVPIQSPALEIILGSSSTGPETVLFKADQYVAASRKLTTKILGTDSKTAEHEVWAEVAIPDYEHLFSTTTTTITASKSERSPSRTTKAIERMLVFDRISDPGNMGLLIRSGMALGWHGSWHTPGTVDEFNNKVVRASRALCLDWPTKSGGGWRELSEFLERTEMTLLVADMVPDWILNEQQKNSSSSRTSKSVDPTSLVWWNWPDSLPRTRLPSKIALLMGSEHHGVNISPSEEKGDYQREQEAKDRLLERAIRVSIPMNPAVESMNVATAATVMMWELNRLLAQSTADRASLSLPMSSTTSLSLLQIFDRVRK
ncbi:hypothetical protein BGZ83_009975 [Gryganskiella cystojenkinii]|nr:hypothetical protein BGZ83_009975 [Gryganskiella cystojenkinii]